MFKLNRNNLLPLSLYFLLLFPSPASSIPVDVTDISDEKYFPAVHQELTKAKESIYVAMYEIYVDSTQPESPPYILLQDLINAYHGDLKVRVYLDRSIPFGELSHLEGLQAKNEVAYYLLQNSGVDVQYVSPSRRLHDKQGKKIFEFVIESPRDLKYLNPDAIVIASIRFRDEILNKLNNDEVLKQIRLCSLYL